MKEFTDREIVDLQKKLEDPHFRKKLEQFQDLIYQTCEEYRFKTGMRFIRVVLPRHEIKSLESVVNKISRERKNNSKYNFDDINDLIGVKMLCPYLSNAVEVGKWLYTQNKKFNIKQKTIKKAWVSHKTGYRGYHFTAEPNTSTNPDWIGLKCEIQVKTMCQEAWDAQTHDITYKREEFIDIDFLKHMQQLSKVLAAIDEQGEIIKTQIKRLENKDRERKDAAAKAFLEEFKEIQEKLKQEYNITIYSDLEQISPEDLGKINEIIDKYRRDKNISKRGLCFFAAWLAIITKDPKQEEMALILANEFINKEHKNPIAEDTRAFVFWAFNRFEKAVMSGIRALTKAKNKPKIKEEYIDILKSNLCYWVAEALLANISIKKDIIENVKDYSKYLLKKYPHDIGYLDTLGFLTIALGKSVKKIEKGLNLIHKAQNIDSKSEEQDELLQKFSHRHKGLAYDRIVKKFV